MSSVDIFFLDEKFLTEINTGIMGRCRTVSEKGQGRVREGSGKFQGRFREVLGNDQGRFREVSHCV